MALIHVKRGLWQLRRLTTLTSKVWRGMQRTSNKMPREFGTRVMARYPNSGSSGSIGKVEASSEIRRTLGAGRAPGKRTAQGFQTSQCNTRDQAISPRPTPPFHSYSANIHVSRHH